MEKSRCLEVPAPHVALETNGSPTRSSIGLVTQYVFLYVIERSSVSVQSKDASRGFQTASHESWRGTIVRCLRSLAAHLEENFLLSFVIQHVVFVYCSDMTCGGLKLSDAHADWPWPRKTYSLETLSRCILRRV
jgi:hypothetical protein